MSTTAFRRLIALATQYKESAIFNFALATQLFDLLCREQDVEAIARIRRWDARKTRLLLNALAAMELLEVRGDQYHLRTELATFITSGRPSSLQGLGQLELHQWSNWTDIDRVLAAQGPSSTFQEVRFADSPECVSAFYAAMRAFAQSNAEWIAGLPVFDDVNVVVDMGGGHGTYLCEILKTHERLTGAVWDLEHARRAAEATINEYGLQARARYRCRDLTAEGVLDEPFDCALLFDCLHYLPKDAIRRVFTRLHGYLPEGGYTVVLTQALNPSGWSPRSAAIFSFDMLMNTEFGELHSLEWIERQLETTGFGLTRYDQSPSEMFHLLVARKL